MSVKSLVIAIAIVATSAVAHAYPQFQMSRDQTCTGCHIAPSGGGLLTENGLNVAESISKWGHKPELFYGRWKPPEALVLGGDFRMAGGVFAIPFLEAAAFPMQGDLYAHYKAGKFAVHVTAGLRPQEEGYEAATTVWSREHYVMFTQNPDEPTGLYVRIGRFMPVFGLRLAEHPTYTRRFGGTPLYADTYGIAVEHIGTKFEAHATGFIRDRLIDAAVHDSGGAVYLEARPTETIAVGVEGMVTVSKDDQKYRGGLTAKYNIEPLETLVQAEAILTDQHIDDSIKRVGLTGSLVLSRFMTDWLLVDLGAGVYDPSFDAKYDDRLGFDLNVHWFVDSHLEVVLNGRNEILGLGNGGKGGGYGLLQVHYRL